ncbi:YtxH domain-containing protein [Agromyces silvae]|uniref:YtxH domain-containing protein n=1 Tax=Agromyces silvae TaxID=3388266 RepID=UPI00280BF1E3|nr:YtxH domain-containing protein [Agromyces protaetiae]
MKGKLLFVVGLGVGYVLGTRAGRERYEQIARAADRVWNQPAVQQGVDTVKDFAASKLGDVSETVLDGVKQLIGNQTSKNRAAKPAPARAGATASTTSKSNGTASTTAKSTAAKSNGSNGAKANGAKANGSKATGSKANGSSSSSGTSAASDS